jgi:hypothetical protein
VFCDPGFLAAWSKLATENAQEDTSDSESKK